MAVEPREIRVDGRPGPRPGVSFDEEPPLGELFRQLGNDASRLIRQEIALGKAEFREMGSALAKDAMKFGIAAIFGLLGAMAAVAFLIVALGALIGSYWVSSLIVTVVLLAVAAVLASNAAKDLKERDLAPRETIDTLRADAEWAKHEARVVREEWKS